MGKRSQLKARPSTNVLLFSYAGKGTASGSLSVKLTQWKPRPKRVVITAAIIKSGATMVELNLGANHELVATIMSGGKTATLTHGVKHVGSMTVTIVPGALSWAASCTIKTPDLTFTAEQVGVTWYAQAKRLVHVGTCYNAPYLNTLLLLQCTGGLHARSEEACRHSGT